MLLGQRIKYLREQLNLTQEELGKILNVSKPTISRYEANTNEPNTDTLKKMADYFNVSIDYLLCQTDMRNTKDSVLTPKEHEDIEAIIDDLRVKFFNTPNLKFDGKLATKEDIEAILDATKVGIEMAKIKKRRTE